MYIEIPGLPISTNSSLLVAGNRLVHSPAARNYRVTTEIAITNQIEQNIRLNPIIAHELGTWLNEPLFCHILLYSNWITQKNTIRKSDIQNREKMLVDSCFSALKNCGYSLDDSQIYMLIMTKHEILPGHNDKTIVIIDKVSEFNMVKYFI